MCKPRFAAVEHMLSEDDAKKKYSPKDTQPQNPPFIWYTYECVCLELKNKKTYSVLGKKLRILVTRALRIMWSSLSLPKVCHGVRQQPVSNGRASMFA